MDQAVQNAKRKWYLRWWMWVIYIVLTLIVIGSYGDAQDRAKQVAQNGGASAPITGATVPSTEKDQLEIISHSCGREYGYFKITGQVKNISDKSLENVQAVGSTYTKDHQFVKTDSALIEYNPILPGQTSPYEVMGTDNPAIASCEVEFKAMFGGTIPTKVDD